MIFWPCQDSPTSRRLLTSVVFAALLITWNSELLVVTQLLSNLFFLYWLWTCHEVRIRRPVAISFNNGHWKCHYLSGITEYQLRTGYVLGFIAMLELRCQQQPETKYCLWLLYWDIPKSIHQASGNWNQLRTLIRANRHQKSTDSLSFLP